MTQIPEWFETYSGIKFYPLNPKVEDINIIDIVNSLTQLVRAGGHFKHFYSIASHLINCTSEAEQRTKDWDKDKQEEFLKQVFIHDFTEAYVSDLVSPLKRSIPEYKEVENKIEQVIYEKFGVTLDKNSDNYKLLKEIDVAITAYEAYHLMPNLKHWDTSYSYLVENKDKRDLSHIDLSENKINDVKISFIWMFDELFPNFKVN